MATTISITPGRVWVSGETVTPSKLNDFLQNATIDSEDIVPTGIALPFFGTTAPSGYVLGAGNTLGNASSGATERANSDTLDLFTLLWDATTNSELQLEDSTGSNIPRGASALADFNIDSRLPTPDSRGRSFFGKDDMGGAAAGRLTSASASEVDGATLAAFGGVEEHALTAGEGPSHTHTTSGGTAASAGAHTHNYFTHAGGGAAAGNLGLPTADLGTTTSTLPTSSAGAHTHTVTITVDASGSGSAHTNTPPAMVANVIIKL